MGKGLVSAALAIAITVSATAASAQTAQIGVRDAVLSATANDVTRVGKKATGARSNLSGSTLLLVLLAGAAVTAGIIVAAKGDESSPD